MSTEAFAMSEAARRILGEAMSLPVAERSYLIDELIVSIPPPDAPTEEEFREMLRRRIADFDAGLVEAISEEEMEAELDREFGEL